MRCQDASRTLPGRRPRPGDDKGRAALAARPSFARPLVLTRHSNAQQMKVAGRHRQPAALPASSGSPVGPAHCLPACCQRVQSAECAGLWLDAPCRVACRPCRPCSLARRPRAPSSRAPCTGLAWPGRGRWSSCWRKYSPESSFLEDAGSRESRERAGTRSGRTIALARTVNNESNYVPGVPASLGE